MSKLGKMVKDMVKTKKESVMGKLGDSPYEDPMEPWSVKYNQPVKEETLNEDSILYRYIRSKGYSPEHMDFAHRSAFARSRAFKTYKIMHQKTAEKPQGGISDIIAQKEEVELTEAGVGKLMNFIKSKGLDPTSMDGNQKKNYSGSSEYRVFKVLHPEDPKKKLKETSGMGERGEDWSDATDEPFVKVKAKSKKLKEEADAVDTVTMDIPLLIRVLEYAREDAKTDMDLHKVVENLIKMRGEGTLSMQSYAKIVAIKEHLESLDELSSDLLGRYKKAAGAQASAADKAGDYAKGNKRFSGIIKATKKQFSNDAKKVNELKKQADNMDFDDHLTREDLRKWFSKTDPEGDWKRINSKGEVAGPCAREPGEPKPKCMSKEKRAELSKSERASAVATKRKHDPVADRAGKGGKPVNVSNYGKGKLSEEDVDEACWPGYKQVGMKKKGTRMVPNCVMKTEEVEQIDEKNKPTNPALWSRAKSMARSKFDVYPSAYANGWASKWYKSKGGGWKSANESTESKAATLIKSLHSKKLRESMYDWEKDDKGDNKKPNAKVIMKGGTTMTGKPRDTVEIEPVLKTRPNSASGGKPSV